ncbi:hypothetical protein QYE76_010851 [Lolium multiflorum]|uniref:Uncharacterized protein n=1 Tax=Lolium multiflorum TaxID=4521 RepID=A0AAD8TXU8_LOLMU|nr:hypothetical protein QYE76_010851 [Lolium multiflorum]
MNPLSGRVPEAISESPEMGFAAAASPEGFPYRGSRWGFAKEAISRRKGNVGATRGPHTTVGAAKAGRTALWWRPLVAPLRLLFGLRKLRAKIGPWAVISSNSENISLLGFLKPKTGENNNRLFGILLIDMASPINFNQFLEKEKLKRNGSNFTDWFHHVRIFLNGGNLQYVLDAPLGDPPAETETDEVKNVYATRKTRYSQVQCAILCSLQADLQKRFEHHDPHELINELKTIFETHAAVECYEASKHFFSCMMEEGSSLVSTCSP